MIELSNPLEVAAATNAKMVSVVKIRSVFINANRKAVEVSLDLGDETVDGFVVEATRKVRLSLTESLVNSMVNKIETALVSKFAEKLGVESGTLTVK